MKRALFAFIALVMVLTVVPFTVFGAASLVPEVDIDEAVKTGDEVYATVDIPEGFKVTKGTVIVTYDSDKLEISEAEAGYFIEDNNFTSNINTSYTYAGSKAVMITFSGSAASDEEGGTVIDLTFVSKKSGSAKISVTGSEFYDASGAKYSTQDASATVTISDDYVEPTETDDPTDTDVDDPTDTDVDDPTDTDVDDPTDTDVDDPTDTSADDTTATETQPGTSETQPGTSETLPVVPGSGNFALAAQGATYVIYSVDAEGNDGAPNWYGNGTDSSFTVLNDDDSGIGEIAGKYAGLVGTGKTHKFVFDLGQNRTFNKVVLKNMVNNVKLMGNRGYDLNAFNVLVDGKEVQTKNTESLTDVSKNTYDVTLKFDNVTGKTVTIAATAAGYVLTVDEIQIIGGEDEPEPTSSETGSDASQPEPTTPATQPPVAGRTNYALASEGASYVIRTLGTDGAEGVPGWLNANYADASFKSLNDNISNIGETANQTVALAGTAKTHRFIFDLGQEREINLIVLKNMVNSVNYEYEGSPAGNRGYVLSAFKVSVDGKEIEISASEAEVDSGKYVLDIKLAFANVTGKTVTIDATAAGYVLSLDEIQIFGGEDVPTEPTTTESAVVTETQQPTVTETKPAALVYGDANGDGETNSIDATIVLRYDAGLVSLEGTALASADVNGDGEANSIDATYILRFDSGLIEKLPV